MRFPAQWKKGAIAATLACLALALFITERAAECERKIVKATKIALSITASGDPANPEWNDAKRDLLQLAREAIAINPNYRKITPLIGDELAKWDDWKDAIWIWESVLSSRPHVVAILCNVARGYASTGDPQRAYAYLARAKQLQPRAPAVLSLEVILLSRMGKQDEALRQAKQAIAADRFDYDMLNAAFVLAWRAGDRAAALNAMALRMRFYPDSRGAGLVQLGTFYATEERDHAKALASFREGLALLAPVQRAALLPQIPAEYRAELGITAAP